MTKNTNPLRILNYQPTKWIPHVIPSDEIPSFFIAISRLPTLYIFNNNKENRWDEFLTQRNLLMFTTQYLLALRPGETIALKWTDIWKTPSGKYYIYIRGENNKRKRSRELPVPDHLSKLFEYMIKNFEYKKFWKNSEWIFPSFRNPKNHISRYRYNEIFQKAIKECGLWRPHPTKPYRGLYTAHSLRHSRATHLIQKSNYDLWIVSQILGHNRIDVTSAYLHKCPDIVDYQRNLLN